MEKIVHIVAGGPEAYIPDLTCYKEKDIFWIGVDRGVHYLVHRGITPDMAVGDFDSVSEQEWTEITRLVDSVQRFKPEKDETDMELALIWAAAQEPSILRVFGATGGRLDHLFANVFMLVRFIEKYPELTLHLIDTQNLLSIYLPGEYTIAKDPGKKYISFIPVNSDIYGLTLIGFKYPLHKKFVPFGSSLCISNELIQHNGTFSFEKGIIMMIRSKD